MVRVWFELALVLVDDAGEVGVRETGEAGLVELDLVAGLVAEDGLGGIELDRFLKILDRDLGQSGAAMTTREDFKVLVSDVAMGRVGAIFSLEASRLARSASRISSCAESRSRMGNRSAQAALV